MNYQRHLLRQKSLFIPSQCALIRAELGKLLWLVCVAAAARRDQQMLPVSVQSELHCMKAVAVEHQANCLSHQSGGCSSSDQSASWRQHSHQ